MSDIIMRETLPYIVALSINLNAFHLSIESQNTQSEKGQVYRNSKVCTVKLGPNTVSLAQFYVC